MSDKRKVVVYEYQRVAGQSHYDKVAIGPGIFQKRIMTTMTNHLRFAGYVSNTIGNGTKRTTSY